VDYVRRRYGADRVTHVITYSTIKAKQAINDAARVLDYPVFMGQKLSKMISSDPSVKLKQVLTKQPGKEDLFSPDFAEEYEKNEDSHRIIDAALAIEGLTRGEGVHACAVLIAPDPVNEHVPTKLDTKGGVEITQYEGHTVADMGLLKMDFLGLRTLTVISKALRNIKQNYGVDVDVDKIPFDDPEIFKLLGSGETAGVFQVESDGMTATIKSMQPKNYSHVVALIALYRPGLSDILNETYGTIVYQEQVMQISMKMSGFSAGESDKVRKAVAKKKIKLMQEVVQHWDDGADETMEEHWMNGAVRNGYDRAVAEKIWADVLKFASYAFNKSHSAGYAILVMQTAWLKAHYRNEFMAAVLTSYTGKTDKIVHYVSACRHEGVEVLPPDVNESGTEFTAVKEGIRFGLAGIRGVGEGATESIIKEREAGGPFKNLHDFIERVDASTVNRRVVEALIKAGAFDSTGYPRLQLMRFVDKGNPENIIDSAAKRQKDRANGQVSMFDLFADVADSGFVDEVPAPNPADEWDRHMKLAQEKDVLGIYVSDHPLRPYEYALAKARSYSIVEVLNGYEKVDPDGSSHIEQIDSERSVWIAGMVSSVAKRTTKNGDNMAIVTLEDLESEMTVVVFPKAYKEAASILSGEASAEFGEEPGDLFVRVLGRIDRGDRGDQFLAQKIELLELNEKNNKPKSLEVLVPGKLLNRSLVERMQASFRRHSGLDRVGLYVEVPDGTMMHMEVPDRVDARNVVLFAEMQALVGDEGKVMLVD
jgi:DNA polymerase-3 subunit alpha